MKQKISDAELQQKQELLANAANTLKEEFVGIDFVIDQLIESISTWFIFPELQDRPLIINLWGLTGVGKTALIIRLAALLNYKESFYRFDMGNISKEYTDLREVLVNIFRYKNGSSQILVFDEFQSARTKNENDCEIQNNFTRIIWDVLDSGKFQVSKNNEAEMQRIAELECSLSDALEAGVKVENGLVVGGSEIFLQMLGQGDDYEQEFFDFDCSHRIMRDGLEYFTFLPRSILKILYKGFAESGYSYRDFRRNIDRLNGPETIKLIKKVIERSTANNWIDCSRCCVFILGNLDEAYTMSSTFNPDINPDEFYQQSLLINITHIKRALRRRFRNEQISRLGNNHIIYPAFKEETFRKLIDLELKKVAGKLLQQFNTMVNFTDGFKQMIYNEGVYPTQGSRPVFSTIYQMVNAKMPKLLSYSLVHRLEVDQISFDVKDEKIIYSFFSGKIKKRFLEEIAQLNLEKLRKPSKDDMQAIVAVHESGHAVMFIGALKIIPEYICSTSADWQTDGFLLAKNKWKYLSKNEVIKRIAVCLGGIAAEELVFGEENITRGCGDDIEEATDYATRAVKEYGMGSLPGAIDVPDPNTRNQYHDLNGDHNAEVKKLLLQGRDLALTILNKEKPLLLQMADYLSDERIMKKSLIDNYIKENGSNDLKLTVFIEDGNHLYYRNQLKKQCLEMDSNEKSGFEA